MCEITQPGIFMKSDSPSSHNQSMNASKQRKTEKKETESILVMQIETALIKKDKLQSAVEDLRRLSSQQPGPNVIMNAALPKRPEIQLGEPSFIQEFNEISSQY